MIMEVIWGSVQRIQRGSFDRVNVETERRNYLIGSSLSN